MSISHLCIPRNETVQPPYFQNRIIMSPNSYTHMSVRDLYISRISPSILLQPNMWTNHRSWEYINRSQTHECGNWDWGRTIPRKGIHKWDFRCSVGRVMTYSLFLWALAFLYNIRLNLVKALVYCIGIKIRASWDGLMWRGMDSCDLGWIPVTWDRFLDLGWIPVTWNGFLWLGMDSYDLGWTPVTWYGFLWLGMDSFELGWALDRPSYKPYDYFLCEMVCALKGTIAWDDFFAHCILSKTERKDLTNFP